MRLTPANLRHPRATVEAIWLGRMCYEKALNIQHEYVRKIIEIKEHNLNEPIKNRLFLLEHTPVYTVGLRSHMYSMKEELRLRALGADFFRTDRGGLITFHGPGQLVAYPIMDLSTLSVSSPDEKTRRVGVRRYVHLIEETIIRTVDKLGVKGAHRSPDTGVWLGNGTRKIAAIGINVRRGITSHGLALNCDTDLNWFAQIVPCGLVGKEVTSLSKELGKDVGIVEAIKPLCEQFAEVFQCDLVYDEDFCSEVESAAKRKALYRKIKENISSFFKLDDSKGS
ncbi:unnamed protein product [Anisakis simplex]|uniref:Octanoyl-[acyl-carrier-protein]:protein N-octanoyltransferase LIPT2, mitochondrial n=1 Tax=Anisakis simplex TaxID=6269 RepID=A0A0M3KCI5_ANISI|nr:unnamed protein product [Anisakis simplex]